MNKYRVVVTITEIVPPAPSTDRYDKTITPGYETELVKGAYMIEAAQRPKVAQEVTDFLSRLAGDLS